MSVIKGHFCFSFILLTDSMVEELTLLISL